MTPADKLKELREALEGATPGPWFWTRQNEAFKAAVYTSRGPNPLCQMDPKGDVPNDDARAIVALMNAAPALLAIAEAAAALVKSAQTEGYGGGLAHWGYLIQAMHRLGGE